MIKYDQIRVFFHSYLLLRLSDLFLIICIAFSVSYTLKGIYFVNEVNSQSRVISMTRLILLN